MAILIGSAGAVIVAAVPLIARLAGVDKTVQHELGALPYLLAVSVLIRALGGGAAAALTALGHSRKVLWAALPSTAATVALTPVLVLGPGQIPELGVAGAGIAAILSATTGVVVANHVLARLPMLREAESSRRVLWPGRPRPRKILEVAKVGLPLAATMLIKFAVLAAVVLAAARIDVAAAAAHGVLANLLMFIFIVAVSVGSAATPEVARAVASPPATPGKVALAALSVAATALAAAGGLLLAGSSYVVPVFTDDPAAHDLVISLLPVMVAVALLDGCQAVCGFSLTGLKRPVPSMLIFTVCYGLFALAAAPAANAAGLNGIWVAYLVTTALLLVGQSTALRHHIHAFAP